MNKSVLIVCVNYNSYTELTEYLSSVDRSALACDNVKVDVIVADNSTEVKDVCISEFKNINIKVQKLDNLGYLPGAQSVINKVENITKYDYVVVSNVDIQMRDDFFGNLYKLTHDEDVAWLAPKIYSSDEDRDMNPQVLSRYSKSKLSMLYYMYKYPILYYLYTMTAYKRKKLQPQHDEMDIYAGHGSLIMLTRSFFESYKTINYPIFLFGEELFLAEEILKVGKKVRYVPSLVIHDKGHISTSKLKKKSFFKYNEESIKFILDNYYNE